MKPNLDEQLDLISGKSELARAIRYARLRWDALTRYLDDGRLEILKQRGRKPNQARSTRKTQLAARRPAIPEATGQGSSTR